MLIGGIVFLLLFAFLFFIFVVCLIAFWKKPAQILQAGRLQTIQTEPEITVVVPCYNESNNLRSALDAIKAQEYPKEKMHLIVIDDGSTDSTLEIASSYPEVKVLASNHEGKAAALTKGCRAARTELIVTIDADTIIEKDCLRALVLLFSGPDVGAVTGTSKVKNRNSLLGAFQNIEYHYNNLIRHSFSKAFSNGIWFFGALACYRKSALEKVNYFKPHTLTEDMDIALELKKAGFKVLHASGALSSTAVPNTVRELWHQRKRWWVGVLQALFKNRSVIRQSKNPSILFLYINQFWWSFYAFISLPLLVYQVNFWLPGNSQDALSIFLYLFRWFTLTGPFYVLYKIPEWGISLYSIFGVLAGILSTVMIISAIRLFKDRFSLKNILAIFFYFPYTILLNTLIVFSVLRTAVFRDRYFLR